MFWRILKKDLKRKKTMNIILVLFVILCSMFAAAAVNNIIAVTGGIEHYFDAADVPDVTVLIMNGGENDIEEKIGELPGCRKLQSLFLSEAVDGYNPNVTAFLPFLVLP